MAFDVGMLLAVFAFAWLGAHRGGVEAAIRLGGLVFAYGVSVVLGKLAGAPLAAALGVGPWLGAVAAGTLGFVAVQIGVEIAARKSRQPAELLTDASRVAGAALGIARAALLLFPLLWLAGFSESVRSLNPAAGLPDLSRARSAAIGQALLSATASRLAASGDGATRVTAKLVANPAQSLSALSAMAGDPHLQMLQFDRGFWEDLERGDVQHALARPTFAELAQDAELRRQLAALGLVSEGSALDAQRFQAELSEAMAEVAPRLARLRADPAFQSLLADDALRERVRAGDTLALLGDPRLQQILASVPR